MRSVSGEWVVCGVLLVLATGFLIGSYQFSDAVQRWPFILSITTIGLTIAYAAYRLWAGTFFVSMESTDRTEEPVEEQAASEGEAPSNELAVLAAAISFVLFAILAYGVGFLLASVVFIAGYMLASGQRKPSIIVGVALGFSICIYLLFGSTLNVPLTEGAWLEYSLRWLPF